MAASTDTARLGRERQERHFATGHLLADLKGRTVSSGVVTAGAQGVLFTLTLLSTFLLARLLDPRDFGLIAMVTTVTGFLRIFSGGGFSAGTVQRENITHAQASNLFWINAGMSAGMSLIVAASAPVFAWFYGEPQLVVITVVLSATFLLTGLTAQHTALLNRQMRFKAIAVIQIASTLVGVLVAVGLAWQQSGYWSLVGMQLSMPLVALVLTWFASPWRPQRPAFQTGTRSLVSFGADLTVSGFVWSLARGMDSLLIGRIYGSDALGLYSRAAALLARPLDQFLGPLHAVLVPALSRVQSDPQRYRRTFLQVFETVTLMSLVFAGLFLVLARPLTLTVLGPKWEQAVPIFAGFALCAVFLPLCSASSWLLASQGRGREWLVTSLISGGATVAAFCVGLPFGPAGVAIAYSVCGLALLLPVIFYIAGRRGPIQTVDLWGAALRQLPVCGVVCAATFLTLRVVADVSPLGQLLACGAAGVCSGMVFVSLYSPARQTVMNAVAAVKKLVRRPSQAASGAE